MTPNICAIVVTYNFAPDVLGHLLGAIQPQVAHTVVVDNSETDAIRALLPGWAVEGVAYHSVGENIGIGAAQNIGIQRAAEMGASHVLLAGPRQLAGTGHGVQAGCAAERLTGSGVKPAAVGPRYRLHGANESSSFVQLGTLKFRKVRCTAAGQGEAIPADIFFSSGCLIEVNLMSDIGHLDDSLFIDQVETERCMRAKAKGYRSHGVCDAIMNHALGDSVLRI